MRDDQDPTVGEYARIRQEAFQLTQLAVGYACPVLIGRPPPVAESITSGSGVLVHLGDKYNLLTAAHLIDKTRELRAEAPDTQWHLAGEATSVAFDPEERVLYHDKRNDLLVLRVTGDEAAAAGKQIYQPANWPPPRPGDGEYVFICGYPAAERIQVEKRYWSFAPACIGGALNSVGTGRFGIRFERERWLTYRDGVLPTLGNQLGGMSGGPIFAFRGLVLELVGIVTDHTEAYDVMLAASLELTGEALTGEAEQGDAFG